MIAEIAIIGLIGIAATAGVTAVDRTAETKQLRQELARQRDTHANKAMKEDIGLIAYRLLVMNKQYLEEVNTWINQIGTISREAMPGPYAYDPNRPSGVTQRRTL